MNGMQYRIRLEDDFDMNEIRERVKSNGYKTDGFKGLLFKAYLISENTENEKGQNAYAPLYVWKESEGMNTFIFDGFYDNILQSFGWQTIQIGIPLHCQIKDEFTSARYVQVFEHDILITMNMCKPTFSNHKNDHVGKLLVYNPEKWKYHEFYFYKEKSFMNKQGKIYEVLHISQS